MNKQLTICLLVVLLSALGCLRVTAEESTEPQLRELTPVKWGRTTERLVFPEFSLDSKMLLTFREGKGWLWDLASREIVAVLRHGPDPDRSGIRIGVTASAFSPDGKTLATAGSDHTFKFWDLGSGKENASFEGQGNEIVFPMLFSGDSKTLIAFVHREIQYWDVRKKELRRTLKSSAAPVTAYSSAKRPLLADGLGFFGVPITLLDASTGETVRFPDVVPNGTSHIATDRAEKMLASTGADDMARIWDRTAGKLAASFELPSVRKRKIVLSPDGKILAVSFRSGRFHGGGTFGGGILLYEVPSGKLLTRLEGQDFEYPIFSPDGKLLATAWQNSIRLWSVPAAWRKTK